MMQEAPGLASGFNIEAFPLLFDYLLVFALIESRSLVFAGITLFRKNSSSSRKPVPTRDEYILNLSTSAIFALAIVAILMLRDHGYLMVPLEDSVWSLYKQIGFFLGALILQDTLFYFAHRALHSQPLYRLAHVAHHQVSEPSPWTAFAFSPVESLIHALCLIVIAVVFPLHPVTLIALLVTMSVWAILNHVSLEDLPRSFPHHWLGSWIIGPAHHCVHHRKQHLNYGLYFTYLDQLFRTDDVEYTLEMSRREPA